MSLWSEGRQVVFPRPAARPTPADIERYKQLEFYGFASVTSSVRGARGARLSALPATHKILCTFNRAGTSGKIRQFAPLISRNPYCIIPPCDVSFFLAHPIAGWARDHKEVQAA